MPKGIMVKTTLRCPGSKRAPAQIINSSKGVLGCCNHCAKFFCIYSNGKVVMHKKTYWILR